MMTSRKLWPSRASISDLGWRSPIVVARPPLSLITATWSSAALGSTSATSSNAGTSLTGLRSSLRRYADSPESTRSYAERKARIASSACPAARIFSSAARRPSALIPSILACEHPGVDHSDPSALRDLLPFAVTLGIELLEAGPDGVRGRLEWAAEHTTTGGLMHGGAIMSLADTC